MRRLALLPLLLITACTDPDSPSIQATANLILAVNGPAVVRERILALGAVLVPSELHQWPDLSIRGECPGAAPLRKWFEARGLHRSMGMDDVLCTGLLQMIGGRTPDWEALTAGHARGISAIRLPVVPRDRTVPCCDDRLTFSLVVDRQGGITRKQAPVAPDALADVLRRDADRWRDERAPGRPSEVWLQLLCDRDVAFRSLAPILEACRAEPVGIHLFGLLACFGRTDHMTELEFCMPEVAEARLLPIALPAAPAPLPDVAALCSSLGAPPPENAGVALTVDGSASVQRVAEVLFAILEAGVCGVDLREAAPPK
jgi:hypothetical protein